MEQEPTQEPTQEPIKGISREEVVEALKANPMNLDVYRNYLYVREQEGKTSKDTLKLNVEVAEIFRDAGLKESAIQLFEDAASQAWQEREDDLYAKLLDEVKKLRGY